MILLVLVLATSLATTPMDVDRPALADCGEVAGMAEVIEDADPSTEAIHGTVIAAESRGHMQASLQACGAR